MMNVLVLLTLYKWTVWFWEICRPAHVTKAFPESTIDVVMRIARVWKRDTAHVLEEQSRESSRLNIWESEGVQRIKLDNYKYKQYLRKKNIYKQWPGTIWSEDVNKLDRIGSDRIYPVKVMREFRRATQRNATHEMCGDWAAGAVRDDGDVAN